MSKIIITIIITALIFFSLGYFVTPKTIITKTQGTNTFQAGWDAAKQRLAESGFMPMMEGMEITSVSGEVKQIQGNKISLKIHPIEPLADPELDNRIVEVDNNTKIYQLLERNMEEYQKEMEEFNQKMQEQIESPEAMVEPIMPPEMYTKKEISLSDIKAGEQITAMAQEDIKEAKQFKVVEIIIQWRPAMPEIEPMP